nr:hypothetical protein Iba_chr15dCG8210 [Ipomoea batatas]GME08440.1 hypothetical protein Iba_scaffold7604CG0020 [Ipomoea batatas]
MEGGAPLMQSAARPLERGSHRRGEMAGHGPFAVESSSSPLVTHAGNRRGGNVIKLLCSASKDATAGLQGPSPLEFLQSPLAIVATRSATRLHRRKQRKGSPLQAMHAGAELRLRRRRRGEKRRKWGNEKSSLGSCFAGLHERVRPCRLHAPLAVIGRGSSAGVVRRLALTLDGGRRAADAVRCSSVGARKPSERRDGRSRSLRCRELIIPARHSCREPERRKRHQAALLHFKRRHCRASRTIAVGVLAVTTCHRRNSLCHPLAPSETKKRVAAASYARRSRASSSSPPPRREAPEVGEREVVAGLVAASCYRKQGKRRCSAVNEKGRVAGRRPCRRSRLGASPPKSPL